MKKLVFFVLALCTCLLWADENPYLVKDSTEVVSVNDPVIPGKVGSFRTFYLKDGNVFYGEIKAIAVNGDVTLEAEEGILSLPYTEILEETVTITKKDGTKLNGKLMEEDDKMIVIINKYGKFNVSKAQVDRLERFFGGNSEARIARKKFYAAEEEITSLFLDPTAFVMKPYTFYLTGFSMGYGFNERIQIFTRIPNNLAGDINLSPTFIIKEKADGAIRSNWALVFNFFSNHKMSYEYASYYDEEPINQLADIYEEGENEKVFKHLYGNKRNFFWDASLVYGKRIPLKSGRGNWSMHAGMTINQLLFEKPKTEITYQGTVHKLSGGFSDTHFNAARVFAGLDYDLTRRIKFITELYYDPGNRYLTFGESMDDYFSNGFTSATVWVSVKNLTLTLALPLHPMKL